MISIWDYHRPMNESELVFFHFLSTWMKLNNSFSAKPNSFLCWILQFWRAHPWRWERLDLLFNRYVYTCICVCYNYTLIPILWYGWNAEKSIQLTSGIFCFQLSKLFISREKKERICLREEEAKIIIRQRFSVRNLSRNVDDLPLSPLTHPKTHNQCSMIRAICLDVCMNVYIYYHHR